MTLVKKVNGQRVVLSAQEEATLRNEWRQNTVRRENAQRELETKEETVNEQDLVTKALLKFVATELGLSQESVENKFRASIRNARQT